MDETNPAPSSHENETEAVVETIRTEEPLPAAGAEEPDHDTMSDDTIKDKAIGEEVDPGIGGYEHRDPKTEMPAVPSVKETQDDPKSHDAAPRQKTAERWGSQ
ncbi:MAG TPA: hypothetical protein VGV40_02570 [Solirubrobacteraceae bacterium]|nr:hypothetical protein [Solirubrobacteraceae bacterium]